MTLDQLHRRLSETHDGRYAWRGDETIGAAVLHFMSGECADPASRVRAMNIVCGVLESTSDDVSAIGLPLRAFADAALGALTAFADDSVYFASSKLLVALSRDTFESTFSSECARYADASLDALAANGPIAYKEGSAALLRSVCRSCSGSRAEVVWTRARCLRLVQIIAGVSDSGWSDAVSHLLAALEALALVSYPLRETILSVGGFALCVKVAAASEGGDAGRFQWPPVIRCCWRLSACLDIGTLVTRKDIATLEDSFGKISAHDRPLQQALSGVFANMILSAPERVAPLCSAQVCPPLPVSRQTLHRVDPIRMLCCRSCCPCLCDPRQEGQSFPT